MATWDLSKMKHHLFICNGGSCNGCGAEELTKAIRNEITNRGLDHIIHTTRTRCNGRCQDKCVLISYPQGTWYKELEPDDAPKLINSLIENENYVKKVSHVYDSEGFKRESGVAIGQFKDRERVKKVSK